MFVTGTDTGVGKTHFTCRILRQLRRDGIDAVGYKPLCCGERDDAIALARASDMTNLDAINPVWLRSPLAPWAAAREEKRPFDHQLILDGFEALRSQHACVVIEGAGGWEVPLAGSETMADLAVALAAPVLVVAANRLGALNHTILTVHAIQSRDLTCTGVVLNQTEAATDSDPAARTNQEVLKAFLPDLPITMTEFQGDRETAGIAREFLDGLGLGG